MIVGLLASLNIFHLVFFLSPSHLYKIPKALDRRDVDACPLFGQFSMFTQSEYKSWYQVARGGRSSIMALSRVWNCCFQGHEAPIILNRATFYLIVQSHALMCIHTKAYPLKSLPHCALLLQTRHALPCHNIYCCFVPCNANLNHALPNYHTRNVPYHELPYHSMHKQVKPTIPAHFAIGYNSLAYYESPPSLFGRLHWAVLAELPLCTII